MENIGIFVQGITAVGVLVVAVLTFMGRSTNLLREDINTLREDFRTVRTEIHDMNTRLGRIEGYLRISENNQADHK